MFRGVYLSPSQLGTHLRASERTESISSALTRWSSGSFCPIFPSCSVLFILFFLSFPFIFPSFQSLLQILCVPVFTLQCSRFYFLFSTFSPSHSALYSTSFDSRLAFCSVTFFTRPLLSVLHVLALSVLFFTSRSLLSVVYGLFFIFRA